MRNLAVVVLLPLLAAPALVADKPRPAQPAAQAVADCLRPGAALAAAAISTDLDAEDGTAPAMAISLSPQGCARFLPTDSLFLPVPAGRT